MPKGENANAGDRAQIDDVKGDTESYEDQSGLHTEVATETNRGDSNTAPGTEVDYGEHDIAEDDNTAFSQTDANTATSEETTSTYRPHSDEGVWQDQGSAQESAPNLSNPGSQNTQTEAPGVGGEYTEHTQQENADWFAAQQSAAQTAQPTQSVTPASQPVSPSPQSSDPVTQPAEPSPQSSEPVAQSTGTTTPENTTDENQ